MQMQKSQVVCDWSALLDKDLFTSKGGIDSISCSSNGLLLACAGFGLLYVFDTQTGLLLKEIQFGSEYDEIQNSIQFSPDSNLIVTSGNRNFIKIYDIQKNRKPIQTLTEHNAPVQDVKFSPCGKFIASASDDCSIIIWNQMFVRFVKIHHHRHVDSIDYASNGKFLAAASGQSVIVHSIPNNYKRSRTIYYSGTIPWMRIHPKNNIMATMLEKTHINDIKTGKKIRIQQDSIYSHQIAFSPNNQEFATLVMTNVIDGVSSCSILIISLISFKQSANIPAAPYPYALAFSCDGKYIVEGASDMTIHDVNLHKTRYNERNHGIL